MSDKVKSAFKTRSELEQLVKDCKGKLKSNPQAGDLRAECAALLYAAGRFGAAEREARTSMPHAATRVGALRILARILYLRGRYSRASGLFEQALSAQPESPELVWGLAQCYLQMNDFRRAAELLERHQSSNPSLPLIQKVAERPPFEIAGTKPSTVVRLLRSDPLPVIKLKINGKPVFAFLDSGGPGVTTNLEFARQERYPIVTSQTGAYALRQEAPVEMLVIDSLSIGGLTIENMPGYALEGVRPRFGPYTCEFSLGTGFVRQFLATVDYPRKRLILTRRDVRGARRQHIAQLGKIVARVPFFLAGSHFLLAKGSVKGKKGLIFFVDSGLAAFGRTSPGGPIRQAACMLSFELLEQLGMTSPATVAFPYFYKVDSLGLGRLVQRDLYGFAKDREQGRFNFDGVLVDGLISHAFLRKYAWTIDWDKHEFIFSR